MRIVHVTTNNLKVPMIGVEKYALNLAVAQQANGSDVMIITNRPGALSAACHKHDIPVAVEQGMNQSSPEKAISALVSQFSSFGANIISCQTPHAALQAIRAGNQLGIPCVFTVHIAGHNNGKIDAGNNPVARARSAGMRFTTICVSRNSFESLREQNVPEAELYYVPPGTMPAPPAHAPQAHTPRRPDLIFVGSLDQRKGLDLAILAMAELRQRRGADCPALNIYGTGELEGHYKEIVTVLQLNDIVRFHGFAENVLDWCPASDILLMSSRSESGPLVVLEAMSRGMPIVASEVGNVPDMLPDRRYGRVVPVNSIVPLADAVESLLDDIGGGRFDPGLVTGRHRSLFTIQKMAERVGAVYERMLAASSASR